MNSDSFPSLITSVLHVYNIFKYCKNVFNDTISWEHASISLRIKHIYNTERYTLNKHMMCVYMISIVYNYFIWWLFRENMESFWWYICRQTCSVCTIHLSTIERKLLYPFPGVSSSKSKCDANLAISLYSGCNSSNCSRITSNAALILTLFSSCWDVKYSTLARHNFRKVLHCTGSSSSNGLSKSSLNIDIWAILANV